VGVSPKSVILLKRLMALLKAKEGRVERMFDRDDYPLNFSFRLSQLSFKNCFLQTM
jgi:hypothetical protein